MLQGTASFGARRLARAPHTGLKRALKALIVLFALGPALAQAELRALIIGIDAYEHISPLRGAIADAEDIEQSLKAIGVKDLTKRLDSAASRAQLIQDWERLMARSQPGDTLILTFAGHGSQEPERVAGSEKDGQDEVLLLAGFNPKNARPGERIYDDEFHQWFNRADARGLNVIFLADACHSGTLTRGVDPRAGKLRYRFVSYAIPDDQLSLEAPPDPVAGSAEGLDNVTFLAAGQEYEQIPEIRLFDAHWRPAERGALSWAFARALEGPADQNSDRQLTRDEIKHFLRANVRALAESRQTPNLLPEQHGEEIILPVADASATSSLSAWPKPSIRIDGDPFAAERLRQSLSALMAQEPTEEPDLTFDLTAGEAISRYGDVLARHLSQADLRAVTEKWQSIQRLAHERLGARLSTRVLPNDAMHRRGQQITFEIDQIALPYLVLFSLSGNGTVHFHYPLDGDPPQIEPLQPLSLTFEVTPPFGADHMIAITSDSPLPALIERLAALDGQQQPRAAAEASLSALRTGRRQLGIQGLYTGP